jgi:UDP-glucose 4-epimerase
LATLVLGSSGFIGGRVVRELTKSGVETMSYDVIQSNVEGGGAKWIKADIMDPMTLERVFLEYRVDSVIHLIGYPDIAQCERDPQLSFSLNVLSLQNTLEPMRKADVQHVMFASSAAVYGYDSPTPVGESSPLTPTTVYGFHKMIGEKLLQSYAKSYGIKYSALRLFNVYGADPASGKDVISIFVRRAMNHEPITIKGPGKYRDFVHVDDVAALITKLAAKAGGSSTLNVGTGTRVTLQEIADSVKKHFRDVQVVVEPVPDDGKGIVADVTALKAAADVRFRPPIQGIDAHVSAYSGHRAKGG